jgi:hypothetical protein
MNELDTANRISTPLAAELKEEGKPQRHEYDRGIEVALIAALVKCHARSGFVKFDQASIRSKPVEPRSGRRRDCQFHHDCGHGGPKIAAP